MSGVEKVVLRRTMNKNLKNIFPFLTHFSIILSRSSSISFISLRIDGFDTLIWLIRKMLAKTAYYSNSFACRSRKLSEELNFYPFIIFEHSFMHLLVKSCHCPCFREGTLICHEFCYQVARKA